MLRYTPDCVRTQEMCKKAVEKCPWLLGCVHDNLKTQEMCEKAVEKYPWLLGYAHDNLKTQEMCEKAVEEYPCSLVYVHNNLKTQEMCEKAIEGEPGTLKFVLTVLIHIFCVLRQLRQCHESWTKFLITLKRKKCVTAQSGKVNFICSMFLIGL